jgi:hypothetical protein
VSRPKGAKGGVGGVVDVVSCPSVTRSNFASRPRARGPKMATFSVWRMEEVGLHRGKRALHAAPPRSAVCSRVGFIDIGEAAITTAGVASADRVAESCGAGVEYTRDSSDPSSDG